MKIAVIAANGRSGKAFVEQALAAGHSIRAGVHGTDNLEPHANLAVITCDATNQEDVSRLIGSQDAVASFIGHVKGSPEHVQTDAMKTLVAAMKEENVHRVVSLTGTGVRFPGDKITLLDKILNATIAIIDPARIKDGIAHAKILKSSKLDWTIVRVLKLQNTKPNAFTLTPHGPTKLSVSREEAAQAALEVIEQSSFIHQAPIISK